jgi:uncharacterized RDD family membrane protein YckC
MDELNPYAPPQSDPVLPLEQDMDLPLASRGARLLAVIIDWLIVMAILLPIEAASGALTQSVTSQGGTTFFSFRASEKWQWHLISVVIWAVVNWVFLQNGQTVGKKLLKLQIQRKSGAKIEAARILTHRMLIINLLGLIPWIGWFIGLLDALMIFRAERNTLHDDIADTKVVKLPG